MLKGRGRGSIKNLIYRNWTLFYINILDHWLKCISSNIFGIQIEIELVTELLSSVLGRFFCCTSLFVIFLRVLMSGDPKHFLITLIFLNFESIATMDNQICLQTNLVKLRPTDPPTHWPFITYPPTDRLLLTEAPNHRQQLTLKQKTRF